MGTSDPDHRAAYLAQGLIEHVLHFTQLIVLLEELVLQGSKMNVCSS